MSLIGSHVGPYEVLRLLGVGGMGEVYQARHTQHGRLVALKVLPPVLARRRDMMGRFWRDVEVIQRLHHRNIVRVYDYGQADGLSYMALEYVDGGSLAERLQGGRPLDPAWAIRTAEQVASALDCAHRQGIVHRDVKPSNILLAQDGRVVLTDFGIARGKGLVRVTATGDAVGTPAYMAPEQIRGLEPDARADVYALGVVVYEMLTGRVPFGGDTAAVMYAHISQPPPPLRRWNPALPARLERVVKRALAKHPHQRYASASQFVQALAAAMGDQAAPPARDRRPGPAAWPQQRVYALVGGLVLVALLLVGLTVGRGRVDGNSTPPPQDNPAHPALPAGVLVFARGRDSDGNGSIEPLQDHSSLCVLAIGGAVDCGWPVMPAWNWAPTWSADGTRLAFVSDADGDNEIYLLAADGSDLVRCTSNTIWDSAPAWSPTDMRLAFDSERDGDSEIYLVQVAETQCSAPAKLTDNIYLDGDPAWSADGRLIAFNSYRDGNLEIYVMNADGSGETRLTQHAAKDMNPAWSPDGQWIAFQSDRDGRAEIYLMPAPAAPQAAGQAQASPGSGNPRRVTRSPTDDLDPAWSPDGTWIVFSRRRGHTGFRDLCAVPAGGGEVVYLEYDDAADFGAAWSPVR
jgi:Tol biopolymer transport system component